MATVHQLTVGFAPTGVAAPCCPILQTDELEDARASNSSSVDVDSRARNTAKVGSSVDAQAE